jgi:copper chaperone NosL
MMRPFGFAAFAVLFLWACTEDVVMEVTDPQPLTRQALGYFCGMIIADHPGPKGQVILQGKNDALWFSSARDTLAYTRLPEETEPVVAIFVSDMSKAVSWNHPGKSAWIEIDDAVYVVGSERRGGMGAPEVVPFSRPVDAEAFAGEFGGQVLSLVDVPTDALLGTWENEDVDLLSEDVGE